MKSLKTILLALTLAAGGCSMLEYKSLGGREMLTNAQGHVIGYKERICDCEAGEELDRVVLFTPRRGERGKVVAYEERMKGGVVLRNLNGKRIGSQYVDLRSRGTNARNSGLTIVFLPRDAERFAAAQVAQVTIEDIKQHLGIPN
jgi:hypothetical protein